MWLGALEESEMEQFQEGRRLFGHRAADYERECRNLESVFALSLTPRPPDPNAKAQLLARILNGGQGGRSAKPLTSLTFFEKALAVS